MPASPGPNAERTASYLPGKDERDHGQGGDGGQDRSFGGTPLDRQLPTKTLNEAREMIAGVREASPDFDICVEMHAKFNIAFRSAHPENVRAVRRVLGRGAGAAGKHRRDGAAAAPDKHPYCDRRGAAVALQFPRGPGEGRRRILQPDLARVGGITAAKKIAGMAEVHYVNIAPHNPNGPICTAASLHLVTSIANFLILEQGALEYVDVQRDVPRRLEGEPVGDGGSGSAGHRRGLFASVREGTDGVAVSAAGRRAPRYLAQED